MAAATRKDLVLKARWCTALPIMRGRAESRPHREGECRGSDPHERQMQKRWRRRNEDTDMKDGLTERTIRRTIVGMRFVVRGRLRRDDFGNIAETLRAVMDVRLGDIRLNREGKGSNEYNDAPRRAQVPHFRRFRSRSCHEPAIAIVRQVYAALGTVPQPSG